MYHESSPEEVELEQTAQRPLLTGARAAISAAVLSILGLCIYAIYEHGVAVDTLGQNAVAAASLNSANSRIEELTAEVRALALPEPQAAQPSEPAKGKHVQKAKASSHARPVSSQPAEDDPRWNKVQSQLDEHDKAITSTQQDLSNTRTELRDSIARTHEELAALESKGERHYYEFDILKGKLSSAGSMSIKLRKSDFKHHYADLDLLVDDRLVTKKHVNLYEPAMFYAGNSDQPVQVVINSITKGHIHGYVSEPKYGKAVLSSAPAQNAPHAAAQATSVELQGRLEQASK